MTDPMPDDLFEELYELFGKPEPPPAPGEITVKQFAEMYGKSQPRAQSILKEAVDGGQMTRRKIGQEYYYKAVKVGD